MVVVIGVVVDVVVVVVVVVVVGLLGYWAIYEKKSEPGEQPMKPVRRTLSKPAISKRTQVAQAPQMKPPEQSLPEKPVPEKPEPLPEEEETPEEEKTYVISPMPEAHTIVDVETCTGFAVEASERQLVWREKGGIIGFGNVDYPDAERLSICAYGQWVNVKRVRQESDESEASRSVGPEPRRTFFGMEIGK